MWYQNGAIVSLPHMQSFPVEIAARSITATPRVERVSIVADSPISGEPDGPETVSESVLKVQPTAAVNGALAIAARKWQGITELAAVCNANRLTWPIEDQQGKETLLRCARRALNLQLVNESPRWHLAWTGATPSRMKVNAYTLLLSEGEQR